MKPEFLTVEDVLGLHASILARHGGVEGIRDRGRLESAVASANERFGARLVHENLYEMAATYFLHIMCDYPFVDGNKRTALMAALVFLELNGVSIESQPKDIVDLTLRVAEGKRSTKQIAQKLRILANE